MSTASGIGFKGEKGKPKFNTSNINDIYKGSSASRQKSAPVSRSHGLQVLGKIKSRHMPPPASLPSLKSENSGNDPNINLIPTGPGWGEKEGSAQPGCLALESRPSVHINSSTASNKAISNVTPASTTGTSRSTTVQILRPGGAQPTSGTVQTSRGSPVSVSVPTTAVAAAPITTPPATGTSGTSTGKLWSSVTVNPRARTGGFLDQKSPFFQEEFPVLATGEERGTSSKDDETKEAQYGPGPSLRPQNVGNWRDGGGRVISNQNPEEGSGAAGIIGGISAGAEEMGTNGSEMSGGQASHQDDTLTNQGASRRMPMPPHVRGMIPPHIRAMMPQYHFTGYPNYQLARPPYPFSAEQRFPPGVANRPPPRMMPSDDGDEILRPSVVKDQDLKSFDDMLSHDKSSNDWAAASADVDYSKDLTFSDQEDDHNTRSVPKQHKNERCDSDKDHGDPSYGDHSSDARSGYRRSDDGRGDAREGRDSRNDRQRINRDPPRRDALDNREEMTKQRDGNWTSPPHAKQNYPSRASINREWKYYDQNPKVRDRGPFREGSYDLPQCGLPHGNFRGPPRSSFPADFDEEEEYMHTRHRKHEEDVSLAIGRARQMRQSDDCKLTSERQTEEALDRIRTTSEGHDKDRSKFVLPANHSRAQSSYSRPSTKNVPPRFQRQMQQQSTVSQRVGDNKSSDSQASWNYGSNFSEQRDYSHKEKNVRDPYYSGYANCEPRKIEESAVTTKPKPRNMPEKPKNVKDKDKAKKENKPDEHLDWAAEDDDQPVEKSSSQEPIWKELNETKNESKEKKDKKDKRHDRKIGELSPHDSNWNESANAVYKHQGKAPPPMSAKQVQMHPPPKSNFTSLKRNHISSKKDSNCEDSMSKTEAKNHGKTDNKPGEQQNDKDRVDGKIDFKRLVSRESEDSNSSKGKINDHKQYGKRLSHDSKSNDGKHQDSAETRNFEYKTHDNRKRRSFHGERAKPKDNCDTNKSPGDLKKDGQNVEHKKLSDKPAFHSKKPKANDDKKQEDKKLPEHSTSVTDTNKNYEDATVKNDYSQGRGRSSRNRGSYMSFRGRSRYSGKLNEDSKCWNGEHSESRESNIGRDRVMPRNANRYGGAPRPPKSWQAPSERQKADEIPPLMGHSFTAERKSSGDNSVLADNDLTLKDQESQPSQEQPTRGRRNSRESFRSYEGRRGIYLPRGRSRGGYSRGRSYGSKSEHAKEQASDNVDIETTVDDHISKKTELHYQSRRYRAEEKDERGATRGDRSGERGRFRARGRGRGRGNNKHERPSSASSGSKKLPVTKQSSSEIAGEEWETASESSDFTDKEAKKPSNNADNGNCTSVDIDDQKNGVKSNGMISNDQKKGGSKRGPKKDGLVYWVDKVIHKDPAAIQDALKSLNNKAALKVQNRKEGSAESCKSSKSCDSIKKDALANIDMNNYAGVVVIDDQPEVSIDDPAFFMDANEGFQEVTSKTCKKQQKIKAKAVREEAMRAQKKAEKKAAIDKKRETKKLGRGPSSETKRTSKLPPRLAKQKDKPVLEEIFMTGKSNLKTAPSSFMIEKWDNNLANNIPNQTLNAWDKPCVVASELSYESSKFDKTEHHDSGVDVTEPKDSAGSSTRSSPSNSEPKTKRDIYHLEKSDQLDKQELTYSSMRYKKATSETNEMKLDFTFDANLDSMEGEKPPADVSTNDLVPQSITESKSTGSAHRVIQQTVVSPNSPATDDLGMKIASTKNVWGNHEDLPPITSMFESKSNSELINSQTTSYQGTSYQLDPANVNNMDMIGLVDQSAASVPQNVCKVKPQQQLMGNPAANTVSNTQAHTQPFVFTAASQYRPFPIGSSQMLQDQRFGQQQGFGYSLTQPSQNAFAPAFNQQTSFQPPQTLAASFTQTNFTPQAAATAGFGGTQATATFNQNGVYGQQGGNSSFHAQAAAVVGSSFNTAQFNPTGSLFLPATDLVAAPQPSPYQQPTSTHQATIMVSSSTTSLMAAGIKPPTLPSYGGNDKSNWQMLSNPPASLNAASQIFLPYEAGQPVGQAAGQQHMLGTQLVNTRQNSFYSPTNPQSSTPYFPQQQVQQSVNANTFVMNTFNNQSKNIGMQSNLNKSAAPFKPSAASQQLNKANSNLLGSVNKFLPSGQMAGAGQPRSTPPPKTPSFNPNFEFINNMMKKNLPVNVPHNASRLTNTRMSTPSSGSSTMQPTGAAFLEQKKQREELLQHARSFMSEQSRASTTSIKDVVSIDESCENSIVHDSVANFDEKVSENDSETVPPTENIPDPSVTTKETVQSEKQCTATMLAGDSLDCPAPVTALD